MHLMCVSVCWKFENTHFQCARIPLQSLHAILVQRKNMDKRYSFAIGLVSHVENSIAVRNFANWKVKVDLEKKKMKATQKMKLFSDVCVEFLQLPEKNAILR